MSSALGFHDQVVKGGWGGVGASHRAGIHHTLSFCYYSSVEYSSVEYSSVEYSSVEYPSVDNNY